MKAFTRMLRRVVTIPAQGKALPPRDWVLDLDGDGVVIRKRGERGRAWGLDWKTVIEVALVHDMRRHIPKADGAPRGREKFL